MKILTLGAAILLLAGPALAARAPAPACPPLLLGDSLAVGMGPYAREAGFDVLARQGVGVGWLAAQRPRCARRLILVIGTNDLRGMTPAEASAYAARISLLMARWRARQVVWATPGCFPQDAALEQGSIALDRAIAAQRRRGLSVNRGRQARCSFASPDGIHPSAQGYQSWWRGLAEPPGPARRNPPATLGTRRPAAAARVRAVTASRN